MKDFSRVAQLSAEEAIRMVLTKERSAKQFLLQSISADRRCDGGKIRAD
jgi:hypothetical protein